MNTDTTVTRQPNPATGSPSTPVVPLTQTYTDTQTRTDTRILTQTTQCRSESERSIQSIHGEMGGRPTLHVDLDEASRLMGTGMSIKATARKLGMGEGTLRRALGLVNVRRQTELAATPRQNPSGGAM